MQFLASMVQLPKHRLGKGAAMPDFAGLTVKEASDESGYNPEYIRRLIRYGKLEAVKIGTVFLIRAESLERYMAEQDENDARTGPKRKPQA